MIEFEMKVLSIHPAHDYKGERLICIEFGIENPAVLARNSMQTQVQQQTPLQVPLSNRLILFLTISEWNSLKHKYTNEEMMSCQLNDNGSFTVNPYTKPLDDVVKEKISEAKALAEKFEQQMQEKTFKLEDGKIKEEKTGKNGKDGKDEKKKKSKKDGN